MDQVTRHVPALDHLVAQGVLNDDPFVLIDAGCSGGIDGIWRHFGRNLVAHGFDPQKSECHRLQEKEGFPGVHYHAAFVGLPPDDPFVQGKSSMDREVMEYFNPWNRLSTAYAYNNFTRVRAQSNSIGEDLVDAVPVRIDDFIRDEKLERVDFIKIDVDGPDLDVLQTTRDIVRPCGVLGFSLEVNFTGSHYGSDNTLHNTDLIMRSMGFVLCDLSIRRYSRAALPAPFLLNMFAQTRFGQPIQGDAVYLRDVASPHYRKLWGDEPTASQLLKMVGLYEMFRLPDLAAETLQVWRSTLAPLVDVDRLLDLLTPPLNGEALSHADYLARFMEDPTRFFPEALKPKA